MARFFLNTARPDNITIVKVGENIRFKIGEKERARKKPGESAQKIETTIHLSTDKANVTTPS